jgi:hypothetical protein
VSGDGRTNATGASENEMKQFMIKYRLENGSEAEWHREIATFIAALDADPALSGKITYRCLKARDGAEYYHMATAADDEAIKTLQQRDYFSKYTELTKRVSGGGVVVVPLQVIAETRSGR